jgi:hypothetical protein
VVASHVPYAMEDHKYRDILLWKMKVELTDLKMRAMELVRTIAQSQNWRTKEPQLKFSKVPIVLRRARHSRMDEEQVASRSSLMLMSRRGPGHHHMDRI